MKLHDARQISTTNILWNSLHMLNLKNVQQLSILIYIGTSQKNSSFFVGAYAPLTAEGNIIVDGVLASCYAYSHHDVAHIFMTPIHWFPQMMEWIIGEENGFLGFAKVVEDLERVMLLFHQI